MSIKVLKKGITLHKTVYMTYCDKCYSQLTYQDEDKTNDFLKCPVCIDHWIRVYHSIPYIEDISPNIQNEKIVSVVLSDDQNSILFFRNGIHIGSIMRMKYDNPYTYDVIRQALKEQYK
jgi:hypothetical protein